MSNPMIAPPLFPSHQFMPYMYACLLSMYIHVCILVQCIDTSHGMYKHLGKWLTHRSTEVACFYSLIRCLSLPPHLQIPLSPESSETLANDNCVGICCKSSAHTGAFYIHREHSYTLTREKADRKKPVWLSSILIHRILSSTNEKCVAEKTIQEILKE